MRSVVVTWPTGLHGEVDLPRPECEYFNLHKAAVPIVAHRWPTPWGSPDRGRHWGTTLVGSHGGSLFAGR